MMNRLGLTGSGGGGFINQALYALLAGRAGGQTLQGGTAANDDLTLEGTSHATKTTSYVVLQPTGGNVGIGFLEPTYKLHVRPANNGADGISMDQLGGYDASIVYLGQGATNNLWGFDFKMPTAAATQTTVLSLRGDGKVGINQTTPLTPLHVVGAVTITGGIRPAADSTTALTLCKANGDSVVTVDTTNGRVGINAPAALMPLEIVGVSGEPSLLGSDTSGILSLGAINDFRTIFSQSLNVPYALSIQHRHWSVDNVAYPIAINPLGGNVGVGTTSPATRLDIGDGAMSFTEMTAPGAGAANTARIYAEDDGAGKTRLMVQFATGVAQQIAIEA